MRMHRSTWATLNEFLSYKCVPKFSVDMVYKKDDRYVCMYVCMKNVYATCVMYAYTYICTYLCMYVCMKNVYATCVLYRHIHRHIHVDILYKEDDRYVCMYVCGFRPSSVLTWCTRKTTCMYLYM